MGIVTAQKCKYNGKELQDELGVNDMISGWRNHGARYREI